MLNVLRGAKLTPHEKEMIRSELKMYMHTHPARAPLLLRALDSFTYALRTSVLRPRFQLAAASLVAVFAIAGTSYAAEGALPGEPLYAVKIHVNEQIQGALATTPEAKAQWNAQLASRRLEEAEELAAQNKLNSSASETLAAGINQATDNFDASVASLASSTSDVATVADLQSGMEATLAVHAQVLSQIAQSDPQAHVAVTPILSSVESKVAAITGAQASLTARIASNTQVAQQVAEAQRDVALGQLGQAQALINAQAHVDTAANESSSTTDPDTLTAQSAIEEGDQHLAQGNYGAAIATFQAANLAAHEAKVRAYVQNQIHVTSATLIPTTTIPVQITASVATSDVATTTAATSSATSTIRASEKRNGELHINLGF